MTYDNSSTLRHQNEAALAAVARIEAHAAIFRAAWETLLAACDELAAIAQEQNVKANAAVNAVTE